MIDKRFWEGSARAQTRPFNQEAAGGLISMFEPCDGDRIFDVLMVVQGAGGEPTKLPDCLVKESEPEPMPYSAACSSRYTGVWTVAMQAEYDGLEAAGTFGEISEIPEGSNIVESKWLLKWKGDEHGMVDRVNARLVAKGYSQVKAVTCFDRFAPTASTTSNRLVAVMACKLDWDWRCSDVDRAFIQSKLDNEYSWDCPLGVDGYRVR